MQSGLLKTLKNKKKQRQYRKRLNLVSKKDSGVQLFYALRVRAALAYKTEKETVIIAEKAIKDARKAQATENKQKKKTEAQEKALQRQVRRR